EDGIRDLIVTGVQTCALPISDAGSLGAGRGSGRSRPRPSSAPTTSTVVAATADAGRADANLGVGHDGLDAVDLVLVPGGRVVDQIGRASCREGGERPGGVWPA